MKAGIASHVWTIQEIALAGSMKRFKELVRVLSKVADGIAALVLIRAPFTDTGWTLMAGAAVVGLACFGAIWGPVEDDPDISN
jgi:hypothetical protein